MEIVFSKVAGIDVHKRQVTVAVRVPDDGCGSGGQARAQKVRRFATFYGALLEMAEWLRAEQVTHVVITALIAGERDPAVLADLARGLMRKKIPDLTLALVGRFAAHHGLLAGLHLNHIDHLNTMIGRLEASIDEAVDPFARQRDLLMTIPGIGERAAQTIIAEIGVDMSRFPTADHLASWAGLCPGNNESAGKRKKTSTRNGNAQLCSVLVESAWAVSRTKTRLGARFRRLHRRFGKAGGKKAAVAIAHTILVIVWHVLHDEIKYIDLGADYYTQRDNPDIQKARLVRQLQELGYDVEISRAA